MSRLQSILSGALVSTLVGVLAAQQPGGKAPVGRGVGAGSVTARKAELATAVTHGAAAAQLASIKMLLGTMLIDAVNESASGAEEPEIASFREDEILRAIAKQLQEFIDNNKASDAAEGARALLARIYVKLDKTAEAVRVLADFDAKRAEKSELLQAALTVAPIAELAVKSEEWLKIVAIDPTSSWDKRFEAVFVAIRLAKLELADELLKSIRAHAETKPLEDKAKVVLAEAELMARVGLTAVIPVDRPFDGGTFLVNPLVAAQLNANKQPVGSWRQIRPVEANFKPDYDKAALAKLESDDTLRRSAFYAQIASDAVIGLRILKELKKVDGDIKVPVDDFYLPALGDKAAAVVPPVETVVAALLYKAIYAYPGTEAARIAEIRLHADNLTIGSKAPPFAVEALDGTRITSARFPGKVVLIDFFSVADRDSVAERAAIKKLYDSYQAQDLEIISVAMDVEADRWTVMSAANTFGMCWPIAFDGKGPSTAVARMFGVQAVPARMLIGRDGKVAEDRAWKLTPDAIDMTVQALLRAPAKALLPADAAFLVEDTYLGPKVDVQVARAANDSTKAMLYADVWVTDSTYRLTVKNVEANVDATKVYLQLVLPAARLDVAPVLQACRVSVPLPLNDLKLIKVYIDHTTDDQTIKAMARLAAVMPIVPDTIGYSGPKFSLKLLSTDAIPADYSVLIASDLSANDWTMKVDEVIGKSKSGATQVLVSIRKIASPVERDDRVAVVVPLGSQIGSEVEIMLAQPSSAGVPTQYLLAAKIAR